MSKYLLLLGRLLNKSKSAFRSHRTKVQKVPLQPVETCQTEYGINHNINKQHKTSLMFQLDNSFVCTNEVERSYLSRECARPRRWHSARPFTQRALMSTSFRVQSSKQVLNTVDIKWKPWEVKHN